MNKIILILEMPLCDLPPAISILNVIHNKYEVHFITYNLDQHYKKMFPNVVFHEYSKYNIKTLDDKSVIKRYIDSTLKFRKYIYNEINDIYDSSTIVWVLHEMTLRILDKSLLNYRYIVSVYELFKDIKRFGYLKTDVSLLLKNASKIISCEYNRSIIMKVWFDLSSMPIVLPNKPFITGEFDYSTYEDIIPVIKELSMHKKIIIYQGSFGYDRKLETFIEAVSQLEDYALVLMGTKTDYLKKMEKLYPNKFVYIRPIPAPNHLKITEFAYIGILSYSVQKDSHVYYDPLNIAYCAPNKIYEYGRYSIPMICNDIPGLRYTVDYFNAGLCIDINKVNTIKDAIVEIDKNYEKYKEGASRLYNDIDVDYIIENDILSNI